MKQDPMKIIKALRELKALMHEDEELSEGESPEDMQDGIEAVLIEEPKEEMELEILPKKKKVMSDDDMDEDEEKDLDEDEDEDSMEDEDLLAKEESPFERANIRKRMLAKKGMM